LCREKFRRPIDGLFFGGGSSYTTLVLAFLDFSRPFSIEHEALGKGVGVVLTQDSKALAEICNFFFSFFLDKIYNP